MFKPDVLKATNLKRWNKTVFQNFCDTCGLSKMFNNMSVLTQFWNLCFSTFFAECTGMS